MLREVLRVRSRKAVTSRLGGLDPCLGRLSFLAASAPLSASCTPRRSQLSEPKTSSWQSGQKLRGLKALRLQKEVAEQETGRAS
jgi:hypothetical protein